MHDGKKEFPNTISKSFELPNPVDIKTLEEIFAKPYNYEILGYKLMLCYKKTDGKTSFASSDTLKVGDEMIGWLQYLEAPEDKNIYKVIGLKISETESYITFEVSKVKKPSEVESELTLKYQFDPLTKKATITNSLRTILPKTFTPLLENMYTDLGHRFQKIASNFGKFLPEYHLAGAIKTEKTNSANFYGNPYGLTTTLFVKSESSSLFKIFQTSDFFEKILPNSDSNKHESSPEKKTLKEEDESKVKLKNLSISLQGIQSIEEEVTFTVKKSEQGTLHLLSNKGIHNFDQFGISVEVSNSQEESAITIGVYHNYSYFISSTNSIAKSFNFFGTKIPESGRILEIRIRNMLDTVVRHLYQILAENNLTLTAEPQTTTSLKLESFG